MDYLVGLFWCVLAIAALITLGPSSIAFWSLLIIANVYIAAATVTDDK
jgi:hypothetical protein